MNDQEIMSELKEYVKDILVATLIKETQILRSLSSSISEGEHINLIEFKAELLKSIRTLRKLVDKETIINRLIRDEIEQLSKKTGATIGQSQKVINVYLKLYSLILDKPLKVIRELDCPLDSTTMKKKQRMKNILSMNEYIEWQNKFEIEYGIRLFRDQEYDLNRMRKSLGLFG